MVNGIKNLRLSSLVILLSLLTVSLRLPDRAIAALIPTASAASSTSVARSEATEIALQAPPTDNLSNLSWWQAQVKTQAKRTQNKQYTGCVFGDSISSALGNTLGDRTFNFAMGGLGSISLVEQLKILSTAQVACQKAVIAIGTNDAWYTTRDEVFISKMKQAIQLVRQMGATQITLIPAFYSTLSASYDPSLAGSLERVDAINVLINQVALDEGVAIEGDAIQPLFENHSLKETLTFDGVHLNDQGKKIYRQVLIDILSLQP